MDKQLDRSRRMALFLGIALPLVETIRRSNHLFDPGRFMHWFDDYILGILLLIAGFLTTRRNSLAREYLITAWAVAAGALFLSLWGQISQLHLQEPGIFPLWLVFLGKILILIYIIVGLRLSIISKGFLPKS